MSTAVTSSVCKSLELEWTKLEEPAVPPNHLVDTNIFSRLQGNNFVQVEPSELHFTIHPSDISNLLPCEKRFRIINISQRSTRVNFIPPETKWFKLFYSSPKLFVPGSAILCTVNFKPDESRYYEDFIRVHTEDDDNHLLIPIYAYPVATDLSFPEYVRLPGVPLGETVIHRIHLRGTENVSFDFLLKKIKDHPSFKVTPTKGKINAGDGANIVIQFTPTNYTTCRIDLELHVSQMNFTPKRCSVYGWSKPGIKACKEKESFAKRFNCADVQDAALFDLRPLERTRKAKFQQKIIKSKLLLQTTQDNLHSKEEKQSKARETSENQVAKSLLRSDTTTTERDKNLLRRQQKTLAFEAMIRQDAMEERRNQVRWQAKLGEQPISQQKRLECKSAFNDGWRRYLEQCTDLESLREKKTSNYVQFAQSSALEGRPHRPIGTLAALGSVTPTFRIERLPADNWRKRWTELDKFRQIVYRIIIQQRANKHLKMLQNSNLESTTTDTSVIDIPEDILQDVGRAILPENMFKAPKLIPDCWIEPAYSLTTETVDSAHRLDLQSKLALDLMELSSAFVTPTQCWSAFEVPSAWEWKLMGCEQFDPWEARESARFAFDGNELQEYSVMSILESRIDSAKKIEEKSTNEDECFCTIPTDKQQPKDKSMLLPKGFLKLPNTGKLDNSLPRYPNITFANNPNIGHDLVHKHVEEYLKSPVDKWCRSDTHITEKLSDAAGLKQISTTLDKRFGQVLMDLTTASSEYENMVPLSRIKDNLPCDHVQTQTVLEEISAAEKLLVDNKVNVELTDESVTKLTKEWVEKFPELGSIINPWTSKLERISVEEVKPETAQDLNKTKENDISVVRKTSGNCSDQNEFMRTADAINEEILSLCNSGSFS